MRRLVLGALLLAGAVGAQTPDRRPWSVRFAEAVMQRKPAVSERWDYTAGLMLLAIDRVGERTKDPKFAAYMKENMDRFVGADGTVRGYRTDDYNLDQINQGRLLFPLLSRTNDARYRKAADILRDQLRRQPRTRDGGFWHKQIYPQQMWLDGLYMAEPFYAQYARTIGDTAAFSDITRQFLLVARHTRDARTGLYYHGWDEARAQKWADSTTGRSPHFWGRAMGWYAMAIVDVLDELPESHRDRAQIIRILQDLADAVERVQDPVTGLWYQILDQPSRAGNYHEASGSSMFVYALAKGARKGYLTARSRAVAERGFDGLVKHLVKTDEQGRPSLTGICEVAGLGGALRKDGSYRDGSFAYYVSEPVVADDYKGVGPFILAALELGR
jgi:unsaturated rhamnogalacturonyl hydrolase